MAFGQKNGTGVKSALALHCPSFLNLWSAICLAQMKEEVWLNTSMFLEEIPKSSSLETVSHCGFFLLHKWVASSFLL
jgi:hypothetical protein